MPSPKTSPLRAVPAVSRLLEDPTLRSVAERLGHGVAVAAAREVLNQTRLDLQMNRSKRAPDLDIKKLAAEAARLAEARIPDGVRRAINATGVILHTGLGRAVLPEAVFTEIAAETRGYALVELDADSGKRGRREAATAALLKALLGCEDATVVNNNAAAALVTLAALARGREVIVSRGQLVEIGGGFRVPEVMAESGAKLVEVGTTNRTHLADFERAIGPETAMLFLAHSSNFRMVGFTAEVGIADLVALGKRRKIPVVFDIGSGNLLPELAEELRNEPVVKEALDAGAALVLFSGDKIMGGPQSGVIAGRASLIEKIRRHPLHRALRLDKLILRALETTLALYLDPVHRLESIPTLRMLRRPLSELEAAAARLAAHIKEACPALECATQADSSRLGSGSLPELDIPTCVVVIKHPHLPSKDLAQAFRAHTPPIITRIHKERVLLDPRTLLDGEEAEIVKAAHKLAALPPPSV